MWKTPIAPLHGFRLLNAEEYGNPEGPPVLQVPEHAWPHLLAVAKRKERVRISVRVNSEQNCRSQNVVAVLEGRQPSLPPVLIITPTSGWWRCACERGTGVALWLALFSRMAAQHKHLTRNVVFIGTSGHELGHLGFKRLFTSESFSSLCPVQDERIVSMMQMVKRGRVAFALHLGANLGAARVQEVPQTAREGGGGRACGGEQQRVNAIGGQAKANEGQNKSRIMNKTGWFVGSGPLLQVESSRPSISGVFSRLPLVVQASSLGVLNHLQEDLQSLSLVSDSSLSPPHTTSKSRRDPEEESTKAPPSSADRQRKHHKRHRRRRCEFRMYSMISAVVWQTLDTYVMRKRLWVEAFMAVGLGRAAQRLARHWLHPPGLPRVGWRTRWVAWFLRAVGAFGMACGSLGLAGAILLRLVLFVRRQRDPALGWTVPLLAAFIGTKRQGGSHSGALGEPLGEAREFYRSKGEFGLLLWCRSIFHGVVSLSLSLSLHVSFDAFDLYR